MMEPLPLAYILIGIGLLLLVAVMYVRPRGLLGRR